VTGAVPTDVNFTDCVAVEFTAMLPNDKLVVLTLNVGSEAPSCKTNVSEPLLIVAVRVAV